MVKATLAYLNRHSVLTVQDYEFAEGEVPTLSHVLDAVVGGPIPVTALITFTIHNTDPRR